MKTIRVVAAIIIDEGKIFATQRGYGEFKGVVGNFREERLSLMKHRKQQL